MHDRDQPRTPRVAHGRKWQRPCLMLRRIQSAFMEQAREQARLDFLTNHEIIAAARRNLEQGPWDYLVGGAESETTMRRNRLGLDRLALRPRVGIDVTHLDPSATFLGIPLRIPVLL